MDQIAAYQREMVKIRDELEKVFLEMGTKLNRYGTVNVEEFGRLLEFPAMQSLLASRGVIFELDNKELFEIIDADGSGQLSFDELALALLRLRGWGGMGGVVFGESLIVGTPCPRFGVGHALTKHELPH